MKLNWQTFRERYGHTEVKYVVPQDDFALFITTRPIKASGGRVLCAQKKIASPGIKGLNELYEGAISILSYTHTDPYAYSIKRQANRVEVLRKLKELQLLSGVLDWRLGPDEGLQAYFADKHVFSSYPSTPFLSTDTIYTLYRHTSNGGVEDLSSGAFLPTLDHVLARAEELASQFWPLEYLGKKLRLVEG